MLLKGRRGGTIHIPANQHVDSLGDLRRKANISCSHPLLLLPCQFKKDDLKSLCQHIQSVFFSVDICVFCICVYITGPMLIHLVKRSSAWMCSYSSLTAFPLSMVLWWASYTFNTTAGQQEQSQKVREVIHRVTLRKIPKHF